jgi:putative DNA methylase
VARQCAREKQKQQDFRPVIGVHKWFARRPGGLFRALALSELADLDPARHGHLPHSLNGVCLDPFMGGGTPLLEAARLGLATVGYDTNPMAAWVVARELEGLDADAFAGAADRALRRARRTLRGLHETACEACGSDVPARYFLWARTHRCACGARRPLLADTLIASTKLRRHPTEVHLCAHCLAIHERPPGERPAACPGCAEPYERHLTPPGHMAVCDCGEPYRIPPQGELTVPDQMLACVVYNCPRCHPKSAKRFKVPDDSDHARATRAARRAARGHDSWPTGLIPSGAETRRLHRWGYVSWRDLHLDRQLVSLGALADAAHAEPDAALRRALYTCLSDLVRYQNALCRYDRSAHKPTDVFAVHAFPVPRVICEPHPLGAAGVGSGGFAHIAAKYRRAMRWCREPHETRVHPDGRLTRHALDGEHLAARMVEGMPGTGEASVRCGSLADRPLQPDSVDLVLTDPPYFDAVQYAQLADFHHAWLRRLAAPGEHPDTATTTTDRDAVGGDGVDLAEFAARLTEVYSAAGRALRPGGAFCFTYHHNTLDAYAPVVMACLDACLAVSAGYSCPTEMRASQHIHGRGAATVDAVFVLRKSVAPLASPDEFGDRWVAARQRAMRAAGVKLTDADRACLRHSARALRAIATLRERWDADAPFEQRYAAARGALGLSAPMLVPAPAA